MSEIPVVGLIDQTEFELLADLCYDEQWPGQSPSLAVINQGYANVVSRHTGTRATARLAAEYACAFVGALMYEDPGVDIDKAFSLAGLLKEVGLSEANDDVVIHLVTQDARRTAGIELASSPEFQSEAAGILRDFPEATPADVAGHVYATQCIAALVTRKAQLTD